MTKLQKLFPLLSFIIFLILTVLGRQYVAELLKKKGITDYTSHALLSTGVNILIAIIALIYIKIYKLSTWAGLGKRILMNKWLLLFPVYLVIVNLLFADTIPTAHLL